MAHELNIENGQASMMYVGQVPWHGLGTRLESAPKTADEAVKAAGLDWGSRLSETSHALGVGYFSGDPLTAKPLCASIIGKKGRIRDLRPGQQRRYKILQNREAFSFFDAVIATGKVEYHTAGALGNGERAVWVLAKVAGVHQG